MPELLESPPLAPVEPVTEIFHGVEVIDSYRWLEDQDSPRTRHWLEEQGCYARNYLDKISGREHIRKRIQELLSVEMYDSLQKVGNRYFFRKRAAHQEQPCIYMREGADGVDQLLIDPVARNTGSFTAVKILRISLDGKLLAYEVKQGGERSGSFEILDVDKRERLPDRLPRGFLRGFVFAPDNKGFYYVHHPLEAERPHYWAVNHHVFGADPRDDREIFLAGEDPKLRLGLCFSSNRLGFLVVRFGDKISSSFFLQEFSQADSPELIFQDLEASFVPILINGKVLALTNFNAPNMRIVELLLGQTEGMAWSEIVPEANARLTGLWIVGGRLFVSYLEDFRTRVDIYDLSGNKSGELVFKQDETVRILPSHADSDELLYESESFTQPPAIYRYLPDTNEHILWSKRKVAFDPNRYIPKRVWYPSKDGTTVSMFLVGRRDILNNGIKPTILTGYGGFGASMTPQFSIFVNFLMEKGCIFALANLRGGSEFGEQWHLAGKRRNRQNAYDDFIHAAEWLIENGHTTPEKLAIFGGSNSGLLVGAALAQRPDMFRAVVCIAPLLDMLRYHLFDFAQNWIDEYGTAEDPDDFMVLHAYSPYHRVRSGVAYPATLIISGDADRNCNPLHARKMVARLQAANSSSNPILLDYKEFRGHSPVLPLSERIEGLTDRLAFVCDQLRIPI